MFDDRRWNCIFPRLWNRKTKSLVQLITVNTIGRQMKQDNHQDNTHSHSAGWKVMPTENANTVFSQFSNATRINSVREPRILTLVGGQKISLRVLFFFFFYLYIEYLYFLVWFNVSHAQSATVSGLCDVLFIYSLDQSKYGNLPFDYVRCGVGMWQRVEQHAFHATRLFALISLLPVKSAIDLARWLSVAFPRGEEWCWRKVETQKQLNGPMHACQHRTNASPQQWITILNFQFSICVNFAHLE